MKRVFPDRTLLALIFTLLIVGLIAIADASAPEAINTYSDKFYFVREQLKWSGIGIILMIIASRIKYTYWAKIAVPLFIISLILLLVVLLPNVGFTALGAKRWIYFGFFNFQPSELVKLTLLIYIAKVAAKSKSAIAYFLPVAVVCGLIMLQPDLGTTMVIAFIALSQIFISGVNPWYFVGSLLTGVLATLALIFTSSYRKERLLTFLELTRDPLGSSYHIRQVLLGLGSGGLFGVGLGASRQKYLFLPEASTDSIFAVIAEELGMVGSIFVIFLFALFMYKGLTIARNASDDFGRVLATGITAWISGQAFLNISSMVALVPLTGIPLPFISYGGSSLIMGMLACGILLNISAKSNYVEKKRRR